MMIGTAKSADLPPPVAIQQKTSLPSRIHTTSFNCHASRPSFHCGIVFLTILVMVRTPSGSLQRKRGAISGWGRPERLRSEQESNGGAEVKAWEHIQTPTISNKVGDQLPGAR
jgi:hypothetical protein